MIELSELHPGVAFEDIPEAHQQNLIALLPKLEKIESAFGRKLHFTSAYRSLAHHEKVYELKNEKRIQAGLKPIPVPMGSRHLTGDAVDAADSDRKLGEWVKANVELIKSFGIPAVERIESCLFPTPWVHFQQVPVKSGSFFFWP